MDGGLGRLADFGQPFGWGHHPPRRLHFFKTLAEMPRNAPKFPQMLRNAPQRSKNVPKRSEVFRNAPKRPEIVAAGFGAFRTFAFRYVLC